MKKLSKILCAVLMLALICTSLAFLVSADNTPDTVKATTSGQDMANVAWGNIEGNMLPQSAGWYQYNQKDANGNTLETTQVDAFVVDPAGDDNGYAVLWAGDYQNGPSTWNVQHSYLVGNENLVPLTNNSYYVVDLDIATPTKTITNIEISLCNRNSSGGEFPFGENVVIKKFVDLTEEWVHFTVVASLKTNKLYIFVNGQFVGETGHAYAIGSGKVPEGQTPEEYGLHAQGIKIEVPKQGGQYIYTDESIAFDNVSRRNYTDAESIAVLDAFFAQETLDLTTWEGYPTEVRTGSLPAYVEIDGKEYHDLTEANAVLVGNESKTVNVLNSFPGKLTVSCDATINMNGCTGRIITTEGGTVTEKDGVVTVDAPYSPIETLTSAGNSDVAKYGFATNVKDNIIGKASVVTKGIVGNRAITYHATNSLNGDDYIAYLTEDVQNNSNICNEYIDIYPDNGSHNNGIILTWDGSEQYLVFDYDIARLSDVAIAWNNTSVVRDVSTGSGLWSSGGIAIPSNMMNSGEFVHITLVYDYSTNKAYMFLNNQLVITRETAIMGGSAFTTWKSANGNQVRQEGIRLGQNSALDVAFENMAMRYYKNDDSLKNAIASGDLASWSNVVYNNGYEFSDIAPVIQVDGTYYPTYEAAEVQLTGNDKKEIMFTSAPRETLHVNCNAVIETNGINAEIVYGEGVTYVTEGTKIIVTAPYQMSAQLNKIEHGGVYTNGESYIGSSDLEAIKNAYLGSVAGGQTAGGLSSAKINDFNPYMVTGAGDSNKYIALRANHNGMPAKDVQFTQQYSVEMLSTGNNYYVIDIDAASDTYVPHGMYIAAVLRFANGAGGTPFSRSMFFDEMMTADGNWQHITLVGDMENNYLYIFNNGKLVGIWGDNEGEEGAYNGKSIFNGADVGTSTNLKFQAVKVSNNVGRELNVKDSLYLDALTVRIYDNNNDAGNIQAALASGNLSDWSGNVTGRAGTSLPKIATIDGVAYSSIQTANAALTGAGESTLVLDREVWESISISKTTTVQANGLDNYKVNASAGILNIDASEYGCVGNAYLGYNFVVDGNKYIKLDENNFANYTIATYWFESMDNDLPYDVIFFPAGSTVDYLGDLQLKNNYIENGLLYNTEWYDTDGNTLSGYVVTASDVAQGLELYYALYGEAVETDLTVTEGMKYNLSLYADFDVNLYIKDANGEYVIDGVNYKRYTQQIAVNNLASDLVYEIKFTHEGVEYTEKVVVNVLNYAKTVLGMENVSKMMKKVMISALDYANEAYALLNGNANAEIAAILADPANAEYIVADYTNYGEANTDALTSVISGAQLYLASDVAVMFKVANGYTGKVTITYNDYKGQACSHEFNVVEGQEYIVVDALKVYNLDALFTITAGEVSGTYNLGAYIQGLVEGGQDAGFAQALYTYAKVAKDYKTALNNAQ